VDGFESTQDLRRAVPGGRRSVGIVFQFHHLFAHLTALDNVTLALEHVLKQPREAACQRAGELLSSLDVGARAHAKPHELSGGEAQRVAIARALAVEPAVLLLDEPTASLDRARRDALAATLTRLAADGRTIIVASHDREFVGTCAHRVLALEHGRITISA
jgi:ABC-type polar amino acid transport system ATPase subunit